MTEFKTLKDLKKLEKFGEMGEVFKFSWDEDLKAEAIKWVKNLEIEHKKHEYMDGWCEDSCWARIEILTEFFNLTEEEIK